MSYISTAVFTFKLLYLGNMVLTLFQRLSFGYRCLLVLSLIAAVVLGYMYCYDGMEAQDQAHIVIDFIHIDRAGEIPGNYVPHGQHTDVHDHTIQCGVVDAIKALQNVVDLSVIDQKATLERVKEYIFNGYDGSYKKKEEAYSTLRAITKINGPLHSVKLTETEILCLVWTRMEADVNKSIQAELKSNLIESLADGTILVDSPYCLVGRVTRVVQSLQSLDAEGIVNIKNLDCVREEITHKFSLLREKYFKEHPETEEIYINDEPSPETERVNRELRDYISGVLHDEYKALVTEPQLQKILAPLVEAL